MPQVNQRGSPGAFDTQRADMMARHTTQTLQQTTTLRAMDPSQVLNSITATIALPVALLSTQYDLRAGSRGMQGEGNRISGTTGSWIAHLDACTRCCDGSKANPSRIFWTLHNGIVVSFDKVRSKRCSNVPVSDCSKSHQEENSMTPTFRLEFQIHYP